MDLERAIELATDVRGELVGTGHSFAKIYLDAAIRSMRHARTALIRAAMRELPGDPGPEGWRRLTFADGMPTAVFLQHDPTSDVWVRGRMADGQPVRSDGADVDWAGPMAVDLGADLLASAEARTLAATPIGSALLMDALAHTAWFKPASSTRWTAGVTSARSLVTALADGSAVGALVPGLAGQWIDRDVLLLIEGLGWRRDPAARWLVRDADGGPAPAMGRPS